MQHQTIRKFKTTHPKSIWYVTTTFALVTLAFGIINSLLVLYLTLKLKFSSQFAYNLFAAFNSLTFTLPILAGYLGEKFGYKQMTKVGLVVGILGGITLSVPQNYFLYVGLALVAFAISSVTTSCACLIDLCYDKEDKRRESGFTLYYLLLNIGFLLSSFVGGYLSQYEGYQAAFIAAAVSFCISLIFFSAFSKQIKPYPGRSMSAQVGYTNAIIYIILFSTCIVITILTTILLKFTELNKFILWALVFAVSIGLLYAAWHLKEKLARLKLFAFLLLCIISIAFWSLYMLEPSLLTIFIETNVNRNVFGHVLPPSLYYGLDPFFIILLGLFFSWLWRYLEMKNKDLSLPSKFASSIFSMGMGYLLLVIAITYFTNENHLISTGWIVLSYLLLTIAELLISPIGLAMVGRLSPPGKEGILMGTWQLFTGFSAIISGYLANLADLPKKGLSASVTNPIYAHAFFIIASITVGAGIITLFLIPFIKRLIHDETSI